MLVGTLSACARHVRVRVCMHLCACVQKKKSVYTVTAQTERDKLQTTHEMSLIDRLVLCFERRSSSTDFQ
jgi:hypothetical protein